VKEEEEEEESPTIVSMLGTRETTTTMSVASIEQPANVLHPQTPRPGDPTRFMEVDTDEITLVVGPPPPPSVLLRCGAIAPPSLRVEEQNTITIDSDPHVFVSLTKPDTRHARDPGSNNGGGALARCQVGEGCADHGWSQESKRSHNRVHVA
jgi:hypothetical protein